MVFHKHVLYSCLLVKHLAIIGTLFKIRGSQKPGFFGFKRYSSTESPPICGSPAVLLPPGPTTIPTLSPDIQENKVSHLLKTTKCPPLRHSCNTCLQFYSACLLQNYCGKKFGEVLGGRVPSPVCQYTGATVVCQGISAAWNATLNSGGFFWLLGLVRLSFFNPIFCFSCRQIMCVSFLWAVFMLRSEMNISSITFIRDTSFSTKNSALGHIFLTRS